MPILSKEPAAQSFWTSGNVGLSCREKIMFCAWLSNIIPIWDHALGTVFSDEVHTKTTLIVTRDFHHKCGLASLIYMCVYWQSQTSCSVIHQSLDQLHLGSSG